MLSIPDRCRIIFEKLNNCGFECFAVGGCVRDSLMGNFPSDWDFTTNALPDDIISCMSGYTIIDIGKRFGTICVVIDGEPFEITTYRHDGEYSDSRHPDEVTFSASIEDDLSRRDFTMNSIAYSPDAGFVDPYGGRSDIEKRLIRCTGDPDTRFQEDALRMLRALRFSSKLGFKIDSKTRDAIHRNSHGLNMVHPQRMRKELSGLVMGDNISEVMMEYSDVISVIIPEIIPMIGFAQNNPHHQYDVWQHTAKAVNSVPMDEKLRLAAFFHDIGKPYVKTTDNNGIDHFKKHQRISESIAAEVLNRFSYPHNMVNDILKLIRFHDERFPNLKPDIKRVMKDTGEELFFDLIKLCRADLSAQSEYLQLEKQAHINIVESQAQNIISSGECYKLSQLALSGNDLKEAGYKGESIGKALDILLTSVIKGKVENTKPHLSAFLKSIEKEI